MAAKSIGLTLPENGVRTEGEAHSHRFGPKRANNETDGRVAKWFDAAVSCYGKATALADELGVGEAFLSEMRSGKRGIALRHLLPLLGHTETVLAFVAPLLESIGHHARPLIGPTKEDVLRLSHEESWEAPMFREHLLRVAEEKHGWTREQVLIALKGDSK